MPARILAFAGSLRTDSTNKKLVRVAAEAARAAGAEVTVIDLRDFATPIYDGDLETKDGLPPAARKLKDLFLKNNALLISSPEYNSSISGALKNAIDWVSRPVEGTPPLAEFTGKVVGLLAASPGALGGLRGLVHVRSILGNMGAIVMPDQFALSKAHEAFGPDGALKDAKQAAAVTKVAEAVARTAAKLEGAR
ncbi:MAG: NAD(P)H-dependent oxidoreductase [Planctomycetes bacterium]|nr:NAD(P)H-dependent oxidoreductase [Planctomycetota bacterium]